MVIFEGVVALENEPTRLFSREKVGGDKEQPVLKTSAYSSFDGGGGKDELSSKTSVCVCFRGTRMVVEKSNQR